MQSANSKSSAQEPSVTTSLLSPLVSPSSTTRQDDTTSNYNTFVARTEMDEQSERSHYSDQDNDLISPSSTKRADSATDHVLVSVTADDTTQSQPESNSNSDPHQQATLQFFDEVEEILSRSLNESSERALLQPSSDSSVTASDSDDKTWRTPAWVCNWTLFRREFITLWGLAIPVLLTYFLEFLPSITSVIFVGHIPGQEYLDAAALATTFNNVTALSIGFGLNNALDTLCSQAFGAGKSKMMGVYMQRGVLISAMAFIPMVAVGWFSEDILVAMGQDPEISRLASQFSRCLLPGLPPIFLYDLLRKVMQAESVVRPMIFVALIGNSLNIIGCYLLIYHTNIGFIGAAIARSASAAFFPILCIGYIKYHNLHKNWWDGFSREAFSGWREYIGLSIPGMVAMCLEWWSFEAMLVMSGLLESRDVAIGATTISFNFSAITYMTFLGVATSTSVRVGNALGRNRPLAARLVARVGQTSGFLLACLMSALIFSLRRYLPYIYTSDEATAECASQIFLVLALYQYGDAMNAVNSAIFRGCGWQLVAAGINLMGFDLIGLPLAASFAFSSLRWGVMGLWSGLAAGLGITAFTSLCITVFRMNWRQLAKEAVERTSKGAASAAAH